MGCSSAVCASLLPSHWPGCPAAQMGLQVTCVGASLPPGGHVTGLLAGGASSVPLEDGQARDVLYRLCMLRRSPVSRFGLNCRIGQLR